MCRTEMFLQETQTFPNVQGVLKFCCFGLIHPYVWKCTIKMLVKGLLSIFFLKKPIELECGTEFLTVITVYFKVGFAHLSERNKD